MASWKEKEKKKKLDPTATMADRAMGEWGEHSL